MIKIEKIKSREILDSRGNPTVETEAMLSTGEVLRAAVPSGASTGTYEAVELRDGDKARYGGKGVKKACANITDKLVPAIKNMDPVDLRKIDQKILEIDATKNKSAMGANATLGVSLLMAKCGAFAQKKPLYEHLAQVFGCSKDFQIPTALMNFINGGKHANNGLAIQEFMVVPENTASFAEALRMGSEIFMALKKALAEKGENSAVGDEGGFAPAYIKNPQEALQILLDAISKAKHNNKVRISLDLAANEFLAGKDYELFKGEKAITPGALIKHLKDWTKAYPIASYEDPLSEDDWASWKDMTKELSGTGALLIGDDLFVTNPERFGRGIKEGIATAILIKPNQIGTLSETADVVQMAQKNGYATVVSHRSGETEDAALAHIAVGLGADGIKTGSVSRSERLAKYNELLRIEEKLGGNKYKGALKAKTAVKA
ncbi:phosphopyruvate hydratase [Elusimicrobiota bacterium]